MKMNKAQRKENLKMTKVMKSLAILKSKLEMK